MPLGVVRLLFAVLTGAACLLSTAPAEPAESATPPPRDAGYYARAGLLPDPVTGEKDYLPRELPAAEASRRAAQPRSACSVTCTPYTCQPASCKLPTLQWTPTSVTQVMTAPGTYTVDLVTSSMNNNDARFTLSNTGACDIDAPWVVVNGQRDFYSIPTILQSTLAGTTVPESIAFKLWDLVRKQRYNETPAEGGVEMHSPVKVFCVYGYALCDDSAQVLACLGKQAGLEDARSRNLRNSCFEGHVVSEVKYGGAWHLLDADHEVFYPLPPGNRQLAGVDKLHGDRSLVTRVSRYELPCCEEYGDYMAGLYADNPPSVVGNLWDTARTMRMTLRPGEKLALVNKNMSSRPDGIAKGGKYHTLYGVEPYAYANGQHTYTPPLAAMSTDELEGRLAAVNMERAASPLARLKEGETYGELTVQMACPYVFVGGNMTLNAVLEDSSYITVMFSKTGETYTTLATITEPGSHSVALDSFIAPKASAACYTFFVKLCFNGTAGGARPGIDSLSARGDVQCAMQGLPLFYGTTTNTVEVRFETPQPGAQLAVTHEFATGVPWQPPPAHEAVQPDDGGLTATLTPDLAWSSDVIVPGLECAVSRHVPLSWDPGGVVLLYPDCVARGYGGTSWPVAPGWLTAGTTYYWRVRELSNLCAYSALWSFTTTADAPVHLSGLRIE